MKKTTESKPLILPHQLPAFEKLLKIMRAAFNYNWTSIKLKPRTSTLIVGPSGSGKSYLARAVAEEAGTGAGAAYLPLNASDWILLGASSRGAQITWPMICEFLKRNSQREEGIVIFLDEVDKVIGNDSWNTHLRTEIFSLLDKRVPTGITDKDGDPLSKEIVEKAQKALSERTLILGAGAWQFIWEVRSRPKMGFGEQRIEQESIGLNHLAATLPRELINRFRSDLVVLPPLTKDDYQRMLEQAANDIPRDFRQAFLRLGYARIPEAFSCRQGCRFIEELLLDVVMAEREIIRTNTDPSAMQQTNSNGESSVQPEIDGL